MSDISVIGLGDMGCAIASALLMSGRKVTVWNRTIEKAKQLEPDGAIVAPSAKSAVSASPVTITCIKSHEQTISQLSNCTDVLKNKTVIELSSGSGLEAEALVNLLSTNGAKWLVGTISAFPSGMSYD